MKKSLLIICILLLLTGCASRDNTEALPETSPVLESEEFAKDDSWKYAVAQRLFDEFCFFYDNMEERQLLEEQATICELNKTELGYNCVMAMDRLVGIAMVYHKYLPEEKVEVFEQKSSVLDYARHYTNVKFAYTTDGAHFIAVYHEAPDSYRAPVKPDAINRLRGVQDEYAFLADFADASLYSAVDLFAEDLSGNKKSVPVNFVQLDTIGDKPLSIVSQDSLDDKSLEILSNYQRNTINTNAKNNEWNLYVLKDCKRIDALYSNGEFVKMMTYWYIH